MKLLLFFSFEISLKDWHESGLLDREIRLYQELMRRYPVQVKFLTYGTAEDRQWSSALGNIEIVPVYEKQGYARRRLYRLINTLYFPWGLREDLSSATIYKTNQMIGAGAAVMAKLRYRKPLLVRCGYELSEFLRLEKVSLWHRLGGWLLSFVSYHLADRIHVVTLNDAEVARKRFWVSSRKIVVQTNWVDTETFVPSINTKKNQHEVLFVGRFTKQKNLPLLIDAIADTGLALTVIGAGEDESQIRERALKARVVTNFTGQVLNSAMPRIYQQCAIFVICSRYEGNPKTLLEAMACGCAVIGTNVLGVKNIIDHEKTGLLVPEDPKVLNTAILRLINDRNLCQRLGIAARQWVVKEHSLDVAVEAEWHAYNELNKLSKRDGK